MSSNGGFSQGTLGVCTIKLYGYMMYGKGTVCSEQVFFVIQFHWLEQTH
jgi:hypothetical protein